MSVELLPALRPARAAWSKGRIIGQKRPLLSRHVWSIRVRLEMAGSVRDLALFNMAVDSKLRGCDLVLLRVRDVLRGRSGQGARVADPEQDRETRPLRDHGNHAAVVGALDPRPADERHRVPVAQPHSRQPASVHPTVCAHRSELVASVGLEPSAYGTHSMRRTRVAQIYKKTGNLRAVQLLLGHTKMDSIVCYVDVDIEDALSLSEGIDL